MSRVLRFLQTLLQRTKQAPPTTETVAHDFTRFARQDRVLLRHKKRLRLSEPLRPDQQANGSGLTGKLHHNDIIGKSCSNLWIKSTRGEDVEVTQPTLEEYITLTPRHVTPIYASYAATIVNLLDVHVSAPPSRGIPQVGDIENKIHILEAGTGHGSLTLHLARAIAAANPPLPAEELPDLRLHSNSPKGEELRNQEQPKLPQIWVDWRHSRRAVVHSVERDLKTSRHAESLIRSFRGGLYWPHIDFYTAPLQDWINLQLAHREAEKLPMEFISNSILDLPDVHHCLSDVAKLLIPDGSLLVFAPSISQLGECLKHIQTDNIPLTLAQVVELGEGISTGRKWDLRLVTPRNRRSEPSELAESQADNTEDVAAQDTDGNGSTTDEPQLTREDSRQVLVCRPKVGERLVGGGFVGMWKKRIAARSTAPSDASVSSEHST